jgi:hypothetical protein
MQIAQALTREDNLPGIRSTQLPTLAAGEGAAHSVQILPSTSRTIKTTKSKPSPPLG